MNERAMQAQSIALDLKRSVSRMLRGQISVESFRAERAALIERFNACRRDPATAREKGEGRR